MKMTHPNYSMLYRVGNAFALMNQCMGVVIMEIVLQERLFLFVFGGSDAAYEDDEDALKNVYESRLAKQIWTDYWEKGNRFQAIVYLATFDHYDLQMLLIKDIDQIEDVEFAPN